MRKIIPVLAIAVLCFMAYAPAHSEETMKVVVEGVEDASGNTSGVHIAGVKEQEMIKLRAAAADGTKMEKEIIDALIVKIISIEEELDKRKKADMVLMIGLCAVTILLLLSVFRKKSQ
jgi:hypothetical protein